MCVKICLRTGSPVFGSPVLVRFDQLGTGSGSEIFTGIGSTFYGFNPIGLRPKCFKMDLRWILQKKPCKLSDLKETRGDFVIYLKLGFLM